MSIENSFLIFKEDLDRMDNWAKMSGLFMGAPPPHRFRGSLSLSTYNLVFEGVDTQNESETTIEFARTELIQLYHGYDKTFRLIMVYGAGLMWSPIRLRFDPESIYGSNDLYVVAGFHGLDCLNAALYIELKEWLS